MWGSRILAYAWYTCVWCSLTALCCCNCCKTRQLVAAWAASWLMAWHFVWLIGPLVIGQSGAAASPSYLCFSSVPELVKLGFWLACWLVFYVFGCCSTTLKLFCHLPNSGCIPLDAGLWQMLCKKLLVLQTKQKKCTLTGCLRCLMGNHIDQLHLDLTASLLYAWFSLWEGFQEVLPGDTLICLWLAEFLQFFPSLVT